jgi:hypothetical protein
MGEIFDAAASPDIVLYGECGMANCETYGLAGGYNEIPGTIDNYQDNCGSQSSEAPGQSSGLPPSSCNGDPGMALTYSFTLGANQYAVITAIAALTDPTSGGFTLETIHPMDGNNASQSQVYLTGSYAIDNAMVGVPEPSTWVLLAAALVLLAVYRVRRTVRV